MNKMGWYYLSRALVSAAFGGLLIMIGAPWWASVLVAATAFAFFLWAPISGRYVADPNRGVRALGRDERTQAIIGQASRNAFMITMLLLAGFTLYYGILKPGSVPVHALSLILFIGMMTYYISDLWLRRA
jgi:hypothetical protein